MKVKILQKVIIPWGMYPAWHDQQHICSVSLCPMPGVIQGGHTTETEQVTDVGPQ
jgi:hypothetical protein